MGDRAAGKTSLLNIIERESSEKDLFPVRIDLDETDIEDHLGFFYKIFNALASKAFDSGYFGGRTGKVFSTYLDMVSAYLTPETYTFAPWTFPVQYARARAHGRVGVALDDPAFKDDLKKFSGEIKKTIVFIFDECNVFRKDHFILQKLRNIFMNIPGFMLVFSGTKELFPIMDQIFSPIIRQFKRIEIGAFTREIDTVNCVQVPLQRAGIKSKQAHNLFSNGEIFKDIHGLSGGRPYEIQLICHMLMRRCQMGAAKRFLLNIGVLEEIRSELAAGQDIAERPVIGAVRGLPKNSLEALSILCACTERMKFDDIWATEYIIRSDSRWTKAALAEQKALLVSLGVLEEVGPYIKFAGEQFDRIYLKYVARQKQITLSIWDVPSELAFWGRFERALTQRWKPIISLGVLNTSSSFEDTNATVTSIVDDGPLDEQIFTSMISEELITTLLSPQSKGKYAVIDGRLSHDQEQNQFWLWRPLDASNPSKSEKLLKEFDEMSSRATSVGWILDFKIMEIEKQDPIKLTQRLKSIGNDVFLARISSWLGSYLVEAYVDNRDAALAQSYVECFNASVRPPTRH